MPTTEAAGSVTCRRRRAVAGRSDPPWPTPAECYLAALAPVATISIGTSGTVAEAGPEETAQIVATVADSLIAVGALPVTSTLRWESPGSGPGWHVQLAHRWRRRARQQAARFRAAEHRRLVVQLPLEHATAVIESVSAQDDLVSIQLYGHPWVGDGGVRAHDHPLLSGPRRR